MMERPFFFCTVAAPRNKQERTNTVLIYSKYCIIHTVERKACFSDFKLIISAASFRPSTLSLTMAKDMAGFRFQTSSWYVHVESALVENFDPRLYGRSRQTTNYVRLAACYPSNNSCKASYHSSRSVLVSLDIKSTPIKLARTWGDKVDKVYQPSSLIEFQSLANVLISTLRPRDGSGTGAYRNVCNFAGGVVTG